MIARWTAWAPALVRAVACALLVGLPTLANGQAVVDVVVLGSEPEAIAAAIAAAETGATVRLVTPDARLGGLFTLGALNVLDLRTRPYSYQQGLFERWWTLVGRRAAFDPARAERVFATMLEDAGVDVLAGVLDLSLGTVAEGLVPVEWAGGEVRARQVIDGDADLRFVRAAGATANFGWEGFGVDARMADTLVFRIDGVEWATLRRAAEARGRSWASVDDAVAWGSFGDVPTSYSSSDPQMRLRGLNLGRDDEGGVWVNALLIYGVDPFDAASRADARRRAAREAERIVAWLRPRLPGFAEARLGTVAERLYVRETVHLDAACVLDADHLLDGVTGPFDVAAGGYPLDLQSLTPFDTGFVFGRPDLYGVPLCVHVPARGPERTWAVGRSVGFDPVAHSSARVVPLGMALGEAVGIAAALASGRNDALTELVRDETFVADVRRRLLQRGAFLPPVGERAAVGPTDHRHHGAYRRMLGRGLALGGYDNEPGLNQPASARSFVYLAAEIANRFAFRPELADALVAGYIGLTGPAEPDAIAQVQRAAACRLGLACPEGDDPQALLDAGLWPAGVSTRERLRRGDLYALAALLAEATPASAQDR